MRFAITTIATRIVDNHISILQHSSSHKNFRKLEDNRQRSVGKRIEINKLIQQMKSKNQSELIDT